MNRIKKGDEVYVIAGRDKGQRGTVFKIEQAKNRAYVKGVNMITKHKRGNPQQGIEGGRIQQEACIDLSNLMLWDPVAKAPSRVGIRVLADGKKVRYYKKSNEVVDIVEKTGS
ncbi:MAG: 50S ribosomal protein L24 [Gammaproteobacteria bacterium]|nr:50S ribosomal protein L24 [Gammaproteobacteria bacterium]